MSTPDPFSLLATLNLQGVAVTAGIDPDGNLLPVEGGFLKLLAAAQTHSLPRIHTVAVHPETTIPTQDGDLTTALKIITARNLDELLEKLIVDQQTRWGEIADYAEVFRKHQNFIGRDWLKEQVERFIEEVTAIPGAPAYLLITGRPGTGKTAFVANQVKCDPTAVYHFIRREAELDDPEIMLRSLTAQLRKIHALPIWPQEKTGSAPTTFFHLLNRISQNLEPGERQVIWIDGLDEAFGPAGRFHEWRLDMLFPLLGLPPGIVMVFTSRHDGPLDWLDDILLHKRIDLDENPESNLADIRQYLAVQSQTLGLDLSPGFLSLLAEASEGCFVAAVRYLYPSPYLKQTLAEWSENPKKIPTGLDGWLKYQWNVLMAAAEEKTIPLRVVYGVLGYIAVQEGVITKSLQDDLYLTGPKILMRYLRSDEFEHYMEPVLELSGEFFEVIVDEHGGGKRYRFFHSQFTEFVRQKVLEKDNNFPFERESRRSFSLQRLAFIPLGLILTAGLFYSAFWLTPIFNQLLFNSVVTMPVFPTPVNIGNVFATIPMSSAFTVTSEIPTVTPTEELVVTPTPDKNASVINDNSPLYMNPFTDAPVLEVLHKGEDLTIFGRSPDRSWLVVITTNHDQGWIQVRDVNIKVASEDLLEVLPLPTMTPEKSLSISYTSTPIPTKPPKQKPAPTSTLMLPYP